MADDATRVLAQTITDRWSAYHGDCVEVVGGIPDESIHYTVFSPPFASLYTYSNSPRDMGNCRGEEDFLEHFEFLARELLRVTIPGRLLSFHCMTMPTSKAKHGFIGLYDFRGHLISLFQRAGWIFHSEVCIWKDPVTQMQRTKSLGLLHKTIRGNATMSRMGLADYVVTMRKPGTIALDDRVTHGGPDGKSEELPVRVWQRYASPVWMDIDPSDTLQHRSVREHDDERHICPLQLEVIRRCVRLWTNVDDVVLSPFMGIGSEGYVSLEQGRRFVGAELKDSYYRQAVANLQAAGCVQETLF